MRTLSQLLLLVSCFYFTRTAIAINNDKTTQEQPVAKQVAKSLTNNSKSSTITIYSRVKGSQEQPNVTYILPWQGINKPVLVNGSMQAVQMPTFKPINPKVFKKQVNSYYQLNKKNINE